MLIKLNVTLTEKDLNIIYINLTNFMTFNNVQSIQITYINSTIKHTIQSYNLHSSLKLIIILLNNYNLTYDNNLINIMFKCNINNLTKLTENETKYIILLNINKMLTNCYPKCNLLDEKKINFTSKHLRVKRKDEISNFDLNKNTFYSTNSSESSFKSTVTSPDVKLYSKLLYNLNVNMLLKSSHVTESTIDIENLHLVRI